MVYWTTTKTTQMFLVQGSGYTKRPLGYRVAYPTCSKLQWAKNKNIKKRKKKLYSQNLNSKTKISMKNETIKLYNIKYFSKKISKNIYIYIYNSI